MRRGEKFKRVKILKKEYNQLKKVEEEIISAKVYKRIQAFKLIHKKWKYSAIAEFLSIDKATISEWIKIYRNGGIDNLIKLNYKGGQPKLKKKQLSELRNEAKKGNFKVAKEIQHYINVNFKIKYGLRHVQLLSKKNFNYPLNEQD